MVDPSLDTSWYGGLASGSAPAVWVKMHDGFEAAWPWHQRGGEVLAHEVGHVLGLQHAPCAYEVGDPLPGEKAGGAVDLGFPAEYGWPDCSLAPTDNEGYFGFEVLWELSDSTEPAIMSNHNGVDAPALAFPWMGYPHPGWLDPWHGCLALDAVGVPCSQTELVPLDPDAPHGGAVPPGGSPDPAGVPSFDCNDVLNEIDLCQLLPPPSGNPIEGEDEGDAAGFVPLVPPAGWAPDDGRMVISGFVTPEDGDTPAAAGVVSIMVLPGDELPDEHHLAGDTSGGGPFVLVLLDGAGEPRWATTVPVAGGGAHGEHGEAAARFQPFSVSVPNVADVARVVLVAPEPTLAEAAPSGGAPLLDLQQADAAGSDLVVRFTATDPDGQPVRTIAQWRPDDGEHWQTVALDIREPEARLPLSDLVGSDDGTLRLVATDGLRSTTAEVGGIVMPHQAPSVRILSPADGQQSPAGGAVDLQASAVLPGGEVLGADALVWSTDVHGVIGTGDVISVAGLPRAPTSCA